MSDISQRLRKILSIFRILPKLVRIPRHPTFSALVTKLNATLGFTLYNAMFSRRNFDIYDFELDLVFHIDKNEIIRGTLKKWNDFVSPNIQFIPDPKSSNLFVL